MILDDPELRTQIDKSDMLSHIKSLPEYIEKGWALGQSLNISEFNQFKHIVIIGQDIFSDVSNLLKSLLTPVINIPIIILKEFQLPSWLKGEENLLFQMSHLSCSEKEIQFLQQADENNCTILTICPDGKLAEAANERNIPWIGIPENSTPVAMVFTCLLSVLNKFGLIADFQSQIDLSKEEIRNLISKIDDNVLTPKNPAKRLAIQMVNRWIVIIGAGYMQPVARYWKNQINFYAKCWAQSADLPEMANNLVEGSIFPENMISHTMNVFLHSNLNDQNIQLTTETTKQMLMVAGLGTDLVDARGNSPLSQIFITMLFGDFVAYYLSLAYQVDPSSKISTNLDL